MFVDLPGCFQESSKRKALRIANRVRDGDREFKIKRLNCGFDNCNEVMR